MELDTAGPKIAGYELQANVCCITELIRTYMSSPVNGATLSEAAQLIRGYAGIWRPTTSDGYTWFWSVDFNVLKGRISILFPWSARQPDGTKCLEKPIVALIRGGITENVEQLESIVTQLTSGLRKQAGKVATI